MNGHNKQRCHASSDVGASLPPALTHALRTLGRTELVGGVLLIGAQCIVGVLSATPPIAIVIAVVLTVSVLIAEWFFLRQAAGHPTQVAAWVMGSYVAKIAVLILGLYVPRACGVDVQFPAIFTILAILFASGAQLLVLTRMRVYTVEPTARSVAEHTGSEGKSTAGDRMDSKSDNDVTY